MSDIFDFGDPWQHRDPDTPLAAKRLNDREQLVADELNANRVALQTVESKVLPAPVSSADLADFRELIYDGSQYIFKAPAVIDITRYLPEGQSAISSGTDFRAYILRAQYDLAKGDVTKSVTGVAATDIFTSTAHGYVNGQQVWAAALTGGSGLLLGVPYFVINKTTDTYQLATSPGGSAVNFTTDLSAGTMASGGRGRITFPRMDGTISGLYQVPSGQYWDGLGRSDSPPTLLRATYDGPVISGGPNASEGGLSNMKIIGKDDGSCPNQDILTIGAWSTNGHAFVGGWKLENLKLEHAGRDGLVLDGAIQTRCDQVVSRINGRRGLYEKNQCNNSNFHNCDFTTNQEWGAVLEGASALGFSGNGNFEGNGLSGTGGGLLLDAVTSLAINLHGTRFENNAGPSNNLPDLKVNDPVSGKSVVVEESGCWWSGRTPNLVLNGGRYTSIGSTYENVSGEGTDTALIGANHDGAVWINPKGGLATNALSFADFHITDNSGKAIVIADGIIYRSANAKANAVQVFSPSAGAQTWTKPAECTSVDVLIIQAGSGGGSGRRGAAGTVRTGGGGGGGGGASRRLYRAANLNATESLICALGGAGGAAVTANDTDGNAGTGAVASYFKSAAFNHAGSGGGGGAGAVGSAAGGAAALGGSPGGVGGASSTTAAGGAGAGATAGNPQGGTGGGAGGSITAADASTNGGGGGALTGLAGGTAGIANGGAGGTATQAANDQGAPGGGGGAAGGPGAGGAGGAGAFPGGGGGGGGASLNGQSSGAGGAGGGALVIVTSF